MSDNPLKTNWVEAVRDLSTHEFAPGNEPDSMRTVGGIARGLLYLASDHALNWKLDEVIDSGGVQCWEMNDGQLEVYSTNSVGFSIGRDIMSKATFEDHGEKIRASLSIGNVDPETQAAIEYSGAIMMPTDDGVMLLTKTVEGIAWTNVLHATIAPDNTVTIVDSR